MIPVFPVANGIFPQPFGGQITGMFIFDQAEKVFNQTGNGRDVLICPWITDEEYLYPVGVVARVIRFWTQTMQDQTGNDILLLLAVLEGRGYGRWHTLQTKDQFVASEDIEILDFLATRDEYPAVSGAGWLPSGGYTEFRDKADIPVTIYGTDIETGRQVSIKANLGGLVTQQQAHTIEHGIIRALKVYGLCTPRTLLDSITKETDELKKSVEYGIRFAMPEIIGRTATGACGNPMSNLARFHLARDFIDNLAGGKSLGKSLFDAKRSAMSNLAGDLGLTMHSGVRTLQGLKKGMYHDDTLLKIEVYKKVIKRFPFAPWA